MKNRFYEVSRLEELDKIFQTGYADAIKDLIERMRVEVGYFSSFTKDDIYLLRRLYRAAKIMEGKE